MSAGSAIAWLSVAGQVTRRCPCQAIATLSYGAGTEPSETAEKVDLAGGDSIDAILRGPQGPSDGLGEDVEGNLLPRNATPKSASDFFSGLPHKRISPIDGLLARSRAALQ
jgi:hypothetical protein